MTTTRKPLLRELVEDDLPSLTAIIEAGLPCTVHYDVHLHGGAIVTVENLTGFFYSVMPHGRGLHNTVGVGIHRPIAGDHRLDEEALHRLRIVIKRSYRYHTERLASLRQHRR